MILRDSSLTFKSSIVTNSRQFGFDLLDLLRVSNTGVFTSNKLDEFQ